jgi:hypothetical protein
VQFYLFVYRQYSVGLINYKTRAYLHIKYLAGPNFQVQRNRYDAPIAQRSNAYLVRIIVIDNKYDSELEIKYDMEI